MIREKWNDSRLVNVISHRRQIAIDSRQHAVEYSTTINVYQEYRVCHELEQTPPLGYWAIVFYQYKARPHTSIHIGFAFHLY